MSTTRLDSLLSRLWADFTTLNPQAQEIHALLERRGETIVNDHIAFRTFSDPRMSIDVIVAPFVRGGYVEKAHYHFAQKKLDARHYEHPDPGLPKIFLSELRLPELSTTAQATIRQLLDDADPETWNSPEVCLSGRPWNPTIGDYEQLAAESEYAGWMAALGFRANHFTVSVNALKTIRSLEELNALIRQAGFPLNTEGGEIKGTPQVYLEQSSTLAPSIEVLFRDGPHRVPGCYYEFARRYPLPDGQIFSGFVPQSADKIFQSTDRR
jgi:hypothetical protein